MIHNARSRVDEAKLLSLFGRRTRSGGNEAASALATKCVLQYRCIRPYRREGTEGWNWPMGATRFTSVSPALKMTVWRHTKGVQSVDLTRVDRRVDRHGQQDKLTIRHTIRQTNCTHYLSDVQTSSWLTCFVKITTVCTGRRNDSRNLWLSKLIWSPLTGWITVWLIDWLAYSSTY